MIRVGGGENPRRNAMPLMVLGKGNGGGGERSRNDGFVAIKTAIGNKQFLRKGITGYGARVAHVAQASRFHFKSEW